MSKNEAHAEFFAHFPVDISTEIRDYATNAVLDWSRYLFTRRAGKNQFAFCTHCKKEHESKGLKHGKLAACSLCGTAAHVKASGRGRKTLVDESYLLWYEKSVIEPNSIIARGFYLKRDYTKDYRKTETVMKPVAMYIFEWGKGGKMMHRGYWAETWQSCKTVRSEAIDGMKYKPCYFALHSIKEAVKDTPFQYCTWEHYDHTDRVSVFDLAARYKCIEFLTKIGLGCLVRTKLEGGYTYGAINWNGQTPEKVLRLTKVEIREMRKAGAIGARTLRSYQISKKDGSNLNWSEALAMSDLVEPYHENEMVDLESRVLRRRFTRSQIKRYFLKQMRRDKGSRFRSGRDVLIAYRDYLRECQELGMDMEKQSVLFPNNLHRAHQVTMRKVKLKADEKLKANVAKRAAELKEFCLEYNGYFLRPAASPEEIFQEGKILKHCVGGYTSKYANGHCDIFFVRRIDEPDIPFYTMEVIGSRIAQVYGFGHCIPTDEVKAFVERFKAAKLEKKKSKVKITERQEVAV